jgi:uncharacterized membrane protein
MDAVALATLVAATVTSGLLAGVFLFYAHTVMPGVRQADDDSFMTTFALLDRSIVNPWFMATGFLGAPALTALAAALYTGESVVWWILAALVLHVVMIVVTARAHLPRNDALKAADERPDRDPTTARAAFDEQGWVRWNLLRVLTSVVALGLLCWALVEAGAQS